MKEFVQEYQMKSEGRSWHAGITWIGGNCSCSEEQWLETYQETPRESSLF